MPASRNSGPSPFRTGVSQFALSIVAFGGLSAAGAGAVHAFGDPEASSPRVEIALFTNTGGAPPPLKTRLENSFAGDGTMREPSLPGVLSYDDSAFENAIGDLPGEPGFKVIEIASLGDAAAAEPLPRAPIPGFHERTPAGDLPRIAPDGRTPAQAYSRPFTPAGNAPRISIVVGGLGLNRNYTQAAINELPPEVTLSFVPYAADLQVWVNRARAAGHEVLLELPMEPYDYRNVDTGPQTLLTTLSAEENTRRLNLLLGKTTGYFGVTNYQGAKFATDARSAAPVMAALKSRGLAFVHDGGAARSTLPEAAETTGVGFAVANRIVDAEPSADAIDRELLQLEALAIQNGHAVGVGYAYPVTIDQLRIWTTGLRAKGYQLAPVSSVDGMLR